MDMINDLYEMCDTLGRALSEANEKIRKSGETLSGSDLDYVNKLTHAIKSAKTSIAMCEAEDEGGSYDGGGGGGSYRRGGGYSREGGSYRGGSYDGGGGSYESRSYARGRGRNARRDSMGRYSSRGYSRDGYSGDDEMTSQLRELMEQAPDEQTRQDFQRLIHKMEQR